MKWFKCKKIKCNHNYKEIGKWYFVEEYANKTCVHAAVVYMCKNCGEQYNDWIYEESFSKYDAARDTINTLRNNGFVTKVEFILKQKEGFYG